VKDRYDLDGPFYLGELKRCELMRAGCGPRAKHCKWCDRAISDAIKAKAASNGK